MREVVLANSSEKALVDDSDFGRVSIYNWFLSTDGYVVANRDNTQMYLHRYIMGEPASRVDHRDRNRLNSCRDNLRLCTHTQNLANSGPRRGKRFKGVYPTKNGTYKAAICNNRKQIHIGTYSTEIEAAKAYNRLAYALWGEFAYLNPVG